MKIKVLATKKIGTLSSGNPLVDYDPKFVPIIVAPHNFKFDHADKLPPESFHYYYRNKMALANQIPRKDGGNFPAVRFYCAFISA